VSLFGLRWGNFSCSSLKKKGTTRHDVRVNTHVKGQREEEERKETAGARMTSSSPPLSSLPSPPPSAAMTTFPPPRRYLTMRSARLEPISFASLTEFCDDDDDGVGGSARSQNHLTHNLEFTPRDGSRLLSTTSGDALRVYDVPTKMRVTKRTNEEEEEEEEVGSRLKCVAELRLPKSHYDACWYPAAQANARETMLTLCASKDSGVKLFDVSEEEDDDDALTTTTYLSSSKREKCSYSVKNRNDELVPSISCAFTGNGGKVLGGRREERGACVWDANRPGHECQIVGFDTQSKLTSCFASGNEYNGFIENSDGNIFAAGSYEDGNSVCVYDLRDGFNGSDCCVLSITNPHKNEKTGKMGGGVTRLKFSADGRALFSSARKSNSILCWDLRANVNGSLFTNIQRPNVRSNAKTKFDIEPCGKHLVSGGDDGILRCFDLDQNGKEVFAWKAPPKDGEVLIAAFTFHPLASSLKELADRNEEDGKNDSERIMNDVALGASACGERMYHPSTRRKFTTTTTTSTSDDSSDNSDSSDSDSTSSRGSFSAREEKKMKSERARKELARSKSHRNDNVISVWGYAREIAS